jgi:histidyl-tRNA synthetase
MRVAFGVTTRRRDFVAGMLAQSAHLCGYERLAVPVLERASSFDEQVVGRSPWPATNPAGVFGVQVDAYADGYRTRLDSEEAVLIPEGTVPIARWLTRRLEGDDQLPLPVKLFYDLACYHDEPIDTLNEVKRREFSQFGVEVLGAPTLADWMVRSAHAPLRSARCPFSGSLIARRA